MLRQTAAMLSDSADHYKFRTICKYGKAMCSAARIIVIDMTMRPRQGCIPAS
jgi:hypothetical protein